MCAATKSLLPFNDAPVLREDGVCVRIECPLAFRSLLRAERVRDL